MFKPVLFACALITLAGCALFGGKPETPAQTVYAISADFNGLLAPAVAYESQPRCTEGQDTLKDACSDAEVVAEIRKAYVDATASLDGAEAAVRTPGFDESKTNAAIIAAETAVAAFRRILTNRGLLKL